MFECLIALKESQTASELEEPWHVNHKKVPEIASRLIEEGLIEVTDPKRKYKGQGVMTYRLSLLGSILIEAYKEGRIADYPIESIPAVITSLLSKISALSHVLTIYFRARRNNLLRKYQQGKTEYCDWVQEVEYFEKEIRITFLMIGLWIEAKLDIVKRSTVAISLS